MSSFVNKNVIAILRAIYVSCTELFLLQEKKRGPLYEFESVTGWMKPIFLSIICSFGF